MNRLALTVVVACAGAGCADSAVTAERARVDEGLARAVVSSRIAEIRASAELEQERLTGTPDVAADAGPERGRLTALRERVADLHDSLERGTVDRVRILLRDELASLRLRRAARDDRIRALELVLAESERPTAEETARLAARHWVLASRVALLRADRAIKVAERHGDANVLTPKEVRELADEMRKVARVIYKAFGPVAAALGFDTEAVEERASELLTPIEISPQATKEFENDPIPDPRFGKVRGACRVMRGLLQGWRPRVEALPALQTRRIVLAAAGANGWLLADEIDPDRVVGLLLSVHALLDERGDTERAEVVHARIADVPRDDTIVEWASQLSLQLLALVPEDEGRR